MGFTLGANVLLVLLYRISSVRDRLAILTILEIIASRGDADITNFCVGFSIAPEKILREILTIYILIHCIKILVFFF